MGIFSTAGAAAGSMFQAGAANKAERLQDREFQATRRDVTPFLNLGTDAATFLRGLFFGQGPMADLFSGQERIANPEIAELRERLRNTDPITKVRDMNRAGDFFEETRPNPEFNRLQQRIASLPETVALGAEDPTARGRTFADIVQNFDPTFGFRQSQGEQAINRALASRGLSGSGRTLKALNEFNSNLALGSSDQFLSRIFQMAGFGPSAALGLGGLRANSAALRGSLIQDAGDARASAANAIGQGIGSIARMFVGV